MKGFRNYFSDVAVILQNQRKILVGLFVMFVLASLLDLIGIGLVGGYIALLTQPESNDASFLDNIIGSDRLSTNRSEVILGIGALLISVFLIKAAVSILVNREILRFSNGQMVRLRGEVMSAFQALPYEKFVQRSSAEYVQRVLGYVAQTTNSLMLLLRMISEGIVSLVILSLLASINFIALAGLLLFGGLIFAAYDRLFRRRLLAGGREANLATEGVIQGVQEGFSGLKEIRILGREKFFLDRVVDGSRIVSKVSIFTGTVSVSPRYLIEVAVVLFVVILVLGIYVQSGSLETSYPLIGMFGVASMRLAPAISMVISSTATLRIQRHGLGALARDLSELSSTVSPRVWSSTGPAREKFSSLELNNVVYSYNNASRPALDGISLAISSGESIGVIGESGSGKTTLVDLILGLLTPKSGEVSYNEKQLASVLNMWRSNVAYLPQEVFLSDESLRQNIALGIESSQIDDEFVEQVAQQARLSELVSELPSGVDTMLGERGVRLSGGQRQRVALARAFYHRREVLVLDEATSALDHETEREIVNEIQELKGEKTMIVIAHRLSTLQHCDRIYRLKKGKIIQTGTYDQVIHGPKIES